ncbi:MAG TPA: cbb3-type cytochrome c oxidase subunit I [Virgibacillus sp.]|nr:cbb3-type cytochrome c oxidase subunit I [Virgibacillus sp.]
MGEPLTFVSLKKDDKPIKAYLLVAGTTILTMVVFGILMLLTQGGVMDASPQTFYQYLTIHGTGMIGAVALAAAAVMWYFLRNYVQLSKLVFKINLCLFLVGLIMVVIGVFSFEYAGGWTFLYPLPALSGGMWGTAGALLYLMGMLLLGTGFLLFYIDVGRAIIKKYGSFAKGLGWDIIWGKKPEKDAPSSTVVASTMVTIVNTTGLLAGSSVIIMNMIHVINPSFTFDPLLAKNLTYAFGHIFANSTIYMGVIAVYEILSRKTNRPWKANKPFLIAWTMSTVLTMLVYPHHLLMDTIMPNWILILGQVLSFMNGLPVLVITAYGALMIVYKSGLKWDMGSKLIFISMLGWSIGVVPAIIDSAIIVNNVMHNTKWVPGHFHMYMGLGIVAMVFGFMYYLGENENDLQTGFMDKMALIFYTVGFVGISGGFLTSGALSVPRRFASYIPEWMGPAIFGAGAGVLVLLAVFVFVVYFIRYLLSGKKDMGSDIYEKKLA